MPQFKVLVSEHITHTYVVDAATKEEAEEMFEDGDISFNIEPVKSDTTSWSVALVVDVDSGIQ